MGPFFIHHTSFIYTLILFALTLIPLGSIATCTKKYTTLEDFQSANTTEDQNGFHLNPSLHSNYTSSTYLNYSLNFNTKWRVQFQFNLASCQGKRYPFCVGNGFCFIMNYGSLGDFVGEYGTGLGYCYAGRCGSDSLAILFDFYGAGCESLPLVRLVNSSTDPGSSLVNARDPSGSWLEVNATNCGVNYDTIINYNGTHLSFYLSSSVPWFEYPIQFRSIPNGEADYVGWGMGTSDTIFDLVISNVVVSQDCNDPPVLRKEICRNISTVSGMNQNQTLEYFSQSDISSIPNGFSLNQNLQLQKSLSAFLQQKIDITSPWKLIYQFSLQNCTVNHYGNCTGDGFSFVIQDEPQGLSFVGGSGGNLGYFVDNTVHFNSMAVLYDFKGHCYNNKVFLRLVNDSMNINSDSLVNSTDPTGNWNITDVSKCGHSFENSIAYNGTHLSFFLQDMNIPWFQYPISFSSALVLEANRLAYLGWTMGTGGLTFFLSLTELTLFHTEWVCAIEPIPECTGLNNQTTCTSIQVSQSGIFTFYDGEYNVLQNTSIFKATLNVSSSDVHFQGNLILTSTHLVLAGNSSLTVSGDLVLNGGTIESSSNGHLVVQGCVYLNNTTIYVPPSQKVTDDMLVLETSCLSGNVFVVSSSGCIVAQPSWRQSSLWIVFSDSTQCGFPLPMIGVIVFGFLFILVVVTVIIYMIKRERSRRATEMVLRGGDSGRMM